MSNLQDQIATYFETLGFSLPERSAGFLVADRSDIGGARDTRMVWIVPELEHEDEIPHIEKGLVRQFEEKLGRYPNARGWIVAYTFGGFSQQFHAKAAEHNINLRVPIQFFDTPYKYDEAPDAQSAIKELRNPPIARIPQPYSALSGGEPQEGGDDLLEHLWTEFRLPNGPGLWFVVGPAGIGKTWLFRSLFSRLYDHFIDQKKRLESFPRPVPFIPSYLQRAGAPRTQDLIQSFVESEVATVVPQKTFHWMLLHGYTTWLFDGLDELYMGDPEFFTILEDIFTTPDSRARVLVCARESLLTSCEAFSEFISNYGSDPTVHVYRLDRWGYQPKAAFADLHFDPPKNSQFIKYISRSAPLRSLSSLPYYCDLLRVAFEEGKTEEFVDDFNLINYAILRIVEREREKGLLRLEYFTPNGFQEWLETVASEFFVANFSGVDKADVETYAGSVLRQDLSEMEHQSAVTTLVQFPLFAAGAEPGVITFEHELIAEYLAGRYWAGKILDDPRKVAQLGERRDLSETLIGRYLSSQLAKNPQGIKRVEETMIGGALPDRVFVNLLQLLLLANPARDALAALRTSMERRDLSQIRFEGRDLAGFSFRDCNLSNVVFRDCNLREVRFEGARLAGTKFEKIGREGLRGAQFGDLSRFESAYIDRKFVDDRLAFDEWAQSMTEIRGPILKPCPSAEQLRVLFRKFVQEDGSPRRDELSRQALVRGKRVPGAESPEEFIEACIRFGYLIDLHWHDRVRRVRGEKYDEIVDFVKEWRLSSGLRALLGTICPEADCEHVPQHN